MQVLSLLMLLPLKFTLLLVARVPRQYQLNKIPACDWTTGHVYPAIKV